jgi:MazG family protein
VQETAARFIRLVEIITRLRAPDGCPWDQKQTPQTFRGYLLEETHELLEAISHDDADHIREELGDLLFQIIFLNNLYAEQGRFTLAEVIDTISAKMVRRHPHVFGDRIINSEQELRRQWHAIKKEEKGPDAPAKSPLAAVPKSLPALHRAQRVADRAARTGFDWPDAESALLKAREELAELQTAIDAADQEQIGEELGDLFFALVVFARKKHLDAEHALQSATEKFIARFSRFEAEVAGQGKAIADLTPGALLALWGETKARSDHGKKG